MSYRKWLKDGLSMVCNVKKWNNITKGVVISIIGIFVGTVLCTNISLVLGFIVFIIVLFFTITYGFYKMEE